MGKKYLLEIEEKKDGSFAWANFSPYTAPDLEQVRKEAYEKGYKTAKLQCNIQAEKDLREVGERHYQKGLSDAWEAARKIGSESMYGLEQMGFDFSQCVIPDYNPSWFVVKNYSASECIEKIRQYEQEKEVIKVGDEVEAGDERYVVLQKYLNNIDEYMAVLFNKRNEEIGMWHLYNGDGAIFKKTGRTFPEIAEVLAKMKEADNG